MIFFDFETSSDINLKIVGADVYARHETTQAYMLAWVRDDAPIIRLWDLWCDDSEEQLAELKDAAASGEKFVAWNARFDRLAWNHAFCEEHGLPPLALDQVLDAMALAAACNYPNDLDGASRLAGCPVKKDREGKKAMEQLMYRSIRDQLIRDDPKEFRRLLLRTRRYAGDDVGAMRGCWRYFRPMAESEWAEYHVSERINDRGMTIDNALCEKAYSYHDIERANLNEQAAKLTDGVIDSLTQSKRINAWMWTHLPEGLQSVVQTRAEGKVDFSTGAGVSCDRAHLAALRDAIDDWDVTLPEQVGEMIDLIEWGRSSSALKFRKMQEQAGPDWRLRGQYVWNGAGQTGRYSSRGVQIHNLPREAVPGELDLIDQIVDGMPIEELREMGPVSLTLSRLIRPAFIAPEKKVFVWGDWSAIEARVLPWLANSKDAERVLQEYRDGVDRYRVTAAEIFRTAEVTGTQRQAGKVAVLALGFGGGTNAYRSMARGYGLKFRVDEAQPIVDGWRNNNPWARRFWDQLTRAARSAIRHPGREYEAGRVVYQYHPALMKGTLICWLPDGRPIVYPECSIRDVIIYDEDGDVVDVKRDVVVYRHGNGMRTMWHGKYAENITQAVAGSILRECLTRLDCGHFEVVGHTHDEIIIECNEDEAETAAKVLQGEMEDIPAWAAGLPLDAEITTDVYYHK